MLRSWKVAVLEAVLIVASGNVAARGLSAEPPSEADMSVLVHDAIPPDALLDESQSAPEPFELADPAAEFDDSQAHPKSYHSAMSWFNLRHSHTHGRNVGLGQP